MEKDPYFCCEFKSEYHNEKDVALRDKHPQQKSYEFQDGTETVTISSQFDSGNMKKCEQ